MYRLVDLNTVCQLDRLIRSETTGTNQELAKKLNITRTTLFDTLEYLREEMRAPIVYNKLKKTYEYEYATKFYIGVEAFRAISGEKDNQDKEIEVSDSALDDEIADDRFESEELDYVGGGSDDDEWYKNSADVDADDVLLDRDIDFNNLFF